MAKDVDICGPGEDNTQFKPGGAVKMPTKHYPSSGNMGKGGGGKGMLEGPCSEKPIYSK